VGGSWWRWTTGTKVGEGFTSPDASPNEARFAAEEESWEGWTHRSAQDGGTMEAIRSVSCLSGDMQRRMMLLFLWTLTPPLSPRDLHHKVYAKHGVKSR